MDIRRSRYRRVRRRRANAVTGSLGRADLLSAMIGPEDSEIGSSDGMIVPQSYFEKLDLFKVGRRNRAAVFRLSVDDPGISGGSNSRAPWLASRYVEFAAQRGLDPKVYWESLHPQAGTGAKTQFVYCRAVRFSAEEGTCVIPGWVYSGLGLSGAAGGRLRVEPWLLPSCGAVKIKCLTPGFEDLVRAGAARAADGTFDVTSVLSGPLSNDFCTLTAGTTIPIRCGEATSVYEFLVMGTRRIDTGDASVLDVDGVDLKSTFNAELGLDMAYLTDDVAEILKVAPGLGGDEARALLKGVGYDLLAGLKAAEAAAE